jgi:predicted N-acetyltransferase YhbS
MVIRKATLADLDSITTVEAECSPKAEAATRDEFQDRLHHYADHFLLMLDEDRLVSFVDGFVTDQQDLTDEMYAHADLHNENGAWQMIFGVNTLPSYRRKGLATQLITEFIQDAKLQGRRGVVLTCKDDKVGYYSGFGFVNEGRSDKSSHGNAVWNQMRLTF